MDRLLVDKYGETLCFDQDSNTLKSLPESIDFRKVFIADQDGQAISKDEIVDYKKGDIVITAYSYNTDHVKIIVITDVIGKAEVVNWYNTIKEREYKKENEAV